MILKDSRGNSIIEIVDDGINIHVIDLVNSLYIEIDNSITIECVLQEIRENELVSKLSIQSLDDILTEIIKKAPKA